MIVSVIAYTMAHWIFAEKYWELSHFMEAYLDDTAEDNLVTIQKVNKAVMVNIVLWPVLTVTLWWLTLGKDS
jgi:hypothetical protein